MKKKTMIDIIPPGNTDFYCEHCNGCGFLDCDGIEEFLEAHVRGKTNCKHEEEFIADIIDFYNFYTKNEY